MILEDNSIMKQCVIIKIIPTLHVINNENLFNITGYNLYGQFWFGCTVNDKIGWKKAEYYSVSSR